MEVVVVRDTTVPGARILFGGAYNLWVPSMELALCAPCGALNCEVADRFFFFNLCIVGVIY